MTLDQFTESKASHRVYDQTTMMDDANIMKVLVVDMMHFEWQRDREEAVFFLNAFLGPIVQEDGDTTYQVDNPVSEKMYGFHWPEGYVWQVPNVKVYSDLGIHVPSPEADNAVLAQMRKQTTKKHLQLFRVYRIENKAKQMQELVAALLHRLKEPKPPTQKKEGGRADEYDTAPRRDRIPIYPRQ